MQVTIDRVSDYDVLLRIYFRGKVVGSVSVNAKECTNGRHTLIKGEMQIVDNAKHTGFAITEPDFYD